MLCEGCPIGGQQVETEHGQRGNVDLLCLMDAPDTIDFARERPATGPAGDLLRRTLEALEIETWAIGNTTQCRAPKIESFKALCAQTCRTRITNEINELNPTLVLAMGAAPAEVFFGGGVKVTQMLGRAQTVPGINSPVMVALNPAAYLYTAGREGGRSFREFFDVVTLAVRASRGEVQPLENKEYPPVMLESIEDIAMMEKNFENTEKISLDLETSGFSPFNDYILMGVISDETTPYIFSGSKLRLDESYRDKLFEYLERRDFITYNGQFDVGFLRMLGCNVQLSRDLFLERHLIDETMTNGGLKVRGALDLGVPDWEGDVKKYVRSKKESYSKVPPDVLAKYCALDGIYTTQLAHAMDSQIDWEVQEWVYHNIIVPVTECFLQIKLNGVPVNPHALLEASKELQTEIDYLDGLMRELAGRYFNCSTPQEHARNLFGKWDYIPEEGTGTGRKVLEKLITAPRAIWELLDILPGPQAPEESRGKTSDELKRLLGTKIQAQSTEQLVGILKDKYPHHLYVISLLRRRDVFKTRNTYLKEIAASIQRDSRIHPTLFATGTVTGRATSTGPSVLNVKEHPIIKSIYSPFSRKGDPWYFLHADQSQFELRTYAGLAQDRGLIDFFIEQDNNRKMGKREIDIHSYAQELTGSPDRITAKTFVFGPLYGRTDQSIANSLGLPLSEAERIGGLIRDLFPRGPEFSAEMLEMAVESNRVVTPLGRIRHFPYIDERTIGGIKNQVANFPTQATANDFNFLSVIELMRVINAGELNMEIFFPVHDSIECGSPPEEIDTNISAMIEIMANIPKNTLPELFSDVPFKVDPSYGWSWEEAEPSEMARLV